MHLEAGKHFVSGCGAEVILPRYVGVQELGLAVVEHVSEI